jgi:hypothetical protein
MFQTRNWTPKGGRRVQLSVLMSAATRIGVTVEEYTEHLASDERWCGWHKAWEAKGAFYADPSKAYGVTSDCRAGGVERARLRRAAKKAEVA